MISSILQAIKSRLEEQLLPTVYNYYYTATVANDLNTGQKSKLSAPYVALTWVSNRSIPASSDFELLRFSMEVEIEIVWKTTENLGYIDRVAEQQDIMQKINATLMPQTDYTFLGIENTVSIEVGYTPLDLNYLPSRVSNGIKTLVRVGYFWR